MYIDNIYRAGFCLTCQICERGSLQEIGEFLAGLGDYPVRERMQKLVTEFKRYYGQLVYENAERAARKYFQIDGKGKYQNPLPIDRYMTLINGKAKPFFFLAFNDLDWVNKKQMKRIQYCTRDTKTSRTPVSVESFV